MTKRHDAELLWIKGSDLEDRAKVKEAVSVYKAAAQLGHVSAMSNLGNLLDDKIVPPDPKEAVYWYRRAARKGHSVAAWNLAIHYRKLRKMRWEIYWFNVAARLGDRDAKRELKKLAKFSRNIRSGSESRAR